MTTDLDRMINEIERFNASSPDTSSSATYSIIAQLGVLESLRNYRDLKALISELTSLANEMDDLCE